MKKKNGNVTTEYKVLNIEEIIYRMANVWVDNEILKVERKYMLRMPQYLQANKT